MTCSTPTTSAPLSRFRRAVARLVLPVVVAGLFVSAASAQSMKPAGDGSAIMPPPSAKPVSTADVGIDQKLNTQIPGNLVFRDDAGEVVLLSKYFQSKKPVLFTLVYYGCPRLCTTVLNEMKKALMPVELNPGSDFEIVIVSFDPREGTDLAYKKKKEYTTAYRRPGTEAGWHFLTGDAANIKALTDTVGFRYSWDEKHQQYIHAGGLMVLTPDGKTSKYFYGVDYVPRDIRLALVEAGNGKIGSLSDQVLLYCFQYDPHSGKYSLAILSIVKVAGILTLLCVGTFVVRSLLKDRNRPIVPAASVESVESVKEQVPTDEASKDDAPRDEGGDKTV